MGTWPNRIGAGLLEAPAGLDEVGAGVELYSADFRQVADNLAHATLGLAQLLAGSGGLILSGTAFASGTQMPAGSWLLRDPAGYPLYRATTAAQNLEFVDAAGTLAIYAVPTLRTDALVDVGDADAAAADLDGIRFIAQDAGSAAPSYSLKLGEGTASGSSFSSFTETTGLRVPAGTQLVNVGGTQTISGLKTFTLAPVVSALTASQLVATDGSKALASTGFAASDVARLSQAQTFAAQLTLTLSPILSALTASEVMVTDASKKPASAGFAASDIARLTQTQTLTGDKTFSGALIATNGRLRNVRDTKFGPPASGTYVAGDLWIDLAGAVWQCTTGGTPGTWEQITIGNAATWSGGGAGDITATGQWNGAALLNGYRVRESGEGTWQYDTTLTRWKSERLFPIAYTTWTPVPASATADTHFATLDSGYDWLVERIGWLVNIASTPDSSNYWVVKIKDSGGTSVGTPQTYNTATSYVRYVEAVSTLKDTATITVLACNVAKTGAPGNITITPMTWARKVRN